MRRNYTALATGLATLLASAGSAWATDGPKGKAGDGPAAGPSLSGESSSSAGTTASSRTTGGTDDDVGGMLDHTPGKRGKWFDIGGTWETHGLLWQNNTGAGNRKLFNFAYFYASLNFTKNDRLRIRGGFYQYLLADQAETGVRATDISLSYSHLFRLPADFNLRATVAATAPVSFYSQKASLITAPTGSISLTKYVGGGLSADLNVFGGGYIQKYTTAGGYSTTANSGGAPNPRAIFGGSIEADYAMPFLKSLVLGADGYVAWLWFWDVGSDPTVNGNAYGYGSGVSPGSVMDVNYMHQPVQQLYGFEVFLRYSPPVFYGIHSDITVAIAEGDPTLGYVSRNIDGVAHFFDNYYSTFEMYGALSLRY